MGENVGFIQHFAVLSVMQKHGSCSTDLRCSLGGPGAPNLLLPPWATLCHDTGVQRQHLGNSEDMEAAELG